MSSAHPISADVRLLDAERAGSGARVFKDHMPALDGLRGVAALLVLLAHVPGGSFGRWYDQLDKVGHLGYFGVDIFFVLSGFLITRILLVDKQKGVPLGYFLARRFLRIFPIYYLTLAVYFVWSRYTPSPHANDVTVIEWCAVYLSNFFFAAHPVQHPLGHTWSLAVEEHFYLLWPLVVYGLSFKRARAFAWLFFLPLAVVSAVLIILHFHSADADPENNPAWQWIYRGSMCRSSSLAWGAIFAFSEGWLRDHVKRLPVLLAIMVMAALTVLAGRKVLLPDMWRILAQLIAYAMLSASVVLFVIYLRGSTSIPARLLGSAPLRYVGRISYGLYLYHVLVYHAVGADDSLKAGSVPWWLVLIGMGTTFVVASASFFLIERPILKLQNRFRAKPVPRPDGTVETSSSSS